MIIHLWKIHACIGDWTQAVSTDDVFLDFHLVDRIAHIPPVWLSWNFTQWLPWALWNFKVIHVGQMSRSTNYPHCWDMPGYAVWTFIHMKAIVIGLRIGCDEVMRGSTWHGDKLMYMTYIPYSMFSCSLQSLWCQCWQLSRLWHTSFPVQLLLRLWRSQNKYLAPSPIPCNLVHGIFKEHEFRIRKWDSHLKSSLLLPKIVKKIFVCLTYDTVLPTLSPSFETHSSYARKPHKINKIAFNP